MQKHDIIRLLQQHDTQLRARHVAALHLFGSRARDQGRPGSDVDFLVDFNGPPDFDLYMDLKFYLEELLGCPVDLVTRNALKPALRPQIEQEAIRVA